MTVFCFALVAVAAKSDSSLTMSINSPTSNLDPFACLHAQAKACNDSVIAVVAA